MDNLFTFSEVTEWAQHLAVLLDFEKAYDRVDWSLLEGTLLRLGFLEWIRGNAALHRLASSHVIIRGQMRGRFSLERSV